MFNFYGILFFYFLFTLSETSSMID